MLAGGLVLAHVPSSVGLPCPLRSLTGIPCPFCGLTTSVRFALNGKITASLIAAPLGVVAIVVAVIVLVVPRKKSFAVPKWALSLGAASEWIFELLRFHVL